MKRAFNFIDLSGRRFGRLVVVGIGEAVSGKVKWLCRCDCGNEKNISRSSLAAGYTKSCGCIRREMTIERMTTHGWCPAKKTPEYRAWLSIRKRCYNKKHPYFHLYGGRGISVCDSWRDSFLAFIEDMGVRPAGCSIDRIDFNGNYEPSNCRWANAFQQANNQRKNVYVVVDGIRMSIADAARKASVNYRKLRYFYCRRKLPIERALVRATEPLWFKPPKAA